MKIKLYNKIIDLDEIYNFIFHNVFFSSYLDV